MTVTHTDKTKLNKKKSIFAYRQTDKTLNQKSQKGTSLPFYQESRTITTTGRQTDNTPKQRIMFADRQTKRSTKKDRKRYEFTLLPRVTDFTKKLRTKYNRRILTNNFCRSEDTERIVSLLNTSPVKRLFIFLLWKPEIQVSKKSSGIKSYLAIEFRP